LRSFYLPLIALISFAAFSSCSDNGNGPNNNHNDTTVAKITEAYFPVNEGNSWSYNNGQLLRQLSGDTIINGRACLRLLQGGRTMEAWSLTDEYFAQHLLEREYWFDPPLQIPFDLKVDQPYEFYSLIYPTYDTAAVGSLSGSLTFKGYTTETVNDNVYDSCVYLDYATEQVVFLGNQRSEIAFQEYYARGIGLVLSVGAGDMYLDFAVIDGDTLP
jgi:hypothetical protein